MKHTTRIISILLAILMAFSLCLTAFAAGGNGGNNPLTLVSAKVGDEDLEGSKIPAASEIVLTFSNNVTDASVLAGNIGRIKVKDSENNAASATVAPGDDNKVFIVTLGDLSKGSYTLTVGKELTAKNGNTLEAKIEIAFQVNKGTGNGTGGGNGSNPLNFVSATADGKDLEGSQLGASGKITVTFDRGMTENQEANFAQIGIYNEAGQKIESVTFTDFTKDDDGNSYTVLSYSGLASGSYTLKLGKDLKANNGNTLGKAVNITFTVKNDDDSGSENSFMKILTEILNFFKRIIEFFKSILNR